MGLYGRKGADQSPPVTMVYRSAGAVRALGTARDAAGIVRPSKKDDDVRVRRSPKTKDEAYIRRPAEAQLRRYFELARKTKGNTGEDLVAVVRAAAGYVGAFAAGLLSTPARRAARASCTATSSSTAGPFRLRRLS